MIAAVACTGAILPSAARATLAFNVSSSASWPSGAQWTAAVNSMQAVVNCYNAYGDFGNYNIYVYYNSGIPTAQASYLGSIGFGGTYPNQRVAQHESNHYLGSGTTQEWENMMAGGYWHGAKMNALAAQFDGDGTIIHGDTQHFWPYGLNYDSEVVNSDVYMRNIALMYAERQDDGIGNQANPWSATTVTLTQSDASGTSAFNWYGAWSDGYYAHPNAAYYTGNYSIRTPLNTGAPTATTNSFTFAGDSLTLNNSGNPSAGLLFKGVGSTGILTFKNLILNGGSTHHFSGASDLFQLAGQLTIASGGGTLNSEQGNTNVLAAVTGSGNLAIGVTNSYLVALLSPSNTFTGNINVAGRFQLASGANQNFVIGANGVNNAITGASAQQVQLNGVFNLNLANASTHAGDSWTLVTAANTVYGSTFGMNGFTYAGGLWSNVNGYTYSQSNSRLTSIGPPTTSVWNGSASASWAASANWSAAPSTSNSWLLFATAGPSGTNLADNLMTPGTYTLGNVTFSSSAPAYTITPGTAGVNGFTLNGAITNSGANLQTINDAIYLPYGSPNARTFTTTAGGGDIVLGGVLSGPGGIDKEGVGKLVLNGSSTYAGPTYINGGTLQLGVDQALPSGAVVTLNGGMLNPNGHKNSVSQLIVNNSATSQSNGVLTATGTMDGAMQVGGAAGTSGTYSITGGSLNVANQPMDVGWNGTGTFSQTGGMVTTNNYLIVGRQPTGVGVYNISGGTVTNTASYLALGQQGVGTLTVSGSGVVVASGGGLSVAGLYGGGGSGTVNLNGGGLIRTNVVTTGGGTSTFNFNGGTLQAAAGASASFFSGVTNAVAGAGGAIIDTNGNNVSIASALSGGGSLTKIGSGVLTLAVANSYTDATNVSAGTMQLGIDQALPSTTVLTLNGGALDLNGHANSISQFIVNNSATSQGNGVLTVTGNMDGAMQVGGAAGTSGTYSMTGGSLNVGNQPMDVGWNGTGTFNQTGGLVATNNYLIIGRQATGIGVYNISGGTVTNTASYLALGQQGSGTLTVGGSGVVVAGGAGLSVAGLFGGGGTGTVNLNGGGLIRTNAVTTGGGTSTFNFNGGTLQAAAGASANFFSGVTNAVAAAGGAIIDTNGNNISFATTLSGSGGLTKCGSGTMVVQSTSTYAGPTVISGGVLQVTNILPQLAYSFTSGSAVNTGNNAATVTTTPVGAPVFSAAGGPNGLGVMRLSGSNYLGITASSLPDLSGSASYTIGMWIKTTQTGGSVLYKGTTGAWSSGDEDFYLTSGTPNSNNGGSGTHVGGVQWAGGFVGGNTAVNTGAWKFISIVRSGNASTVYVNGVADGTTTNGMYNPEQGTQFIGLGYNSGVAHDGSLMFSGSISGTYIYGSALTAAQIQSLMNTGPVGISANLPATTALSITRSGAALDLDGAPQTVASLSGVAGASVYLGGGTLTVAGSGNTTFAGNISDSGGASSSAGGRLILNGPGKLILSGTDTFTGGTIVAHGTLVLTNPAALADGTSLTVGNASLFSAAPVVPAIGAADEPAAAVPEPGALTLLAAAAAASAFLARRNGRFTTRRGGGRA